MTSANLVNDRIPVTPNLRKVFLWETPLNYRFDYIVQRALVRLVQIGDEQYARRLLDEVTALEALIHHR